MKIKYLNEDSLLSISDLTSARLAQINFISEHVQFRVEALSKVADFNGEIPSKIYRCHIVNYVRDNLFGKQNSKKWRRKFQEQMRHKKGMVAPSFCHTRLNSSLC